MIAGIIPDLETIAKHKDTYNKMLDEQLEQGLAVIEEQLQFQREYIYIFFFFFWFFVFDINY